MTGNICSYFVLRFPFETLEVSYGYSHRTTARNKLPTKFVFGAFRVLRCVFTVTPKKIKKMSKKLLNAEHYTIHTHILRNLLFNYFCKTLNPIKSVGVNKVTTYYIGFFLNLYPQIYELTQLTLLLF